MRGIRLVPFICLASRGSRGSLVRVPARHHTSPLGLHRAHLDTACARPLPPEAEEGWFGGLDHVAPLFEGFTSSASGCCCYLPCRVRTVVTALCCLRKFAAHPQTQCMWLGLCLGAGLLPLKLFSAFTVPEVLGGHRWWRFRLRQSYSLTLFFSAYKSNTSMCLL